MPGPTVFGGRKELGDILGSHIDEQQRVLFLGITGELTAGASDVTVRVLATRATLYLHAHVQSDAPGGAGSTYDPSNFVSSTELDCRENRQQDITVTRSGGHDFFLWVIPVFKYPDGTAVKYDGVDAEDRMVFMELGT